MPVIHLFWADFWKGPFAQNGFSTFENEAAAAF